MGMGMSCLDLYGDLCVEDKLLTFCVFVVSTGRSRSGKEGHRHLRASSSPPRLPQDPAAV